MKIIIRQKADADLDAIYAWIEKDNPRAAVEGYSANTRAGRSLGVIYACTFGAAWP